MARADQKPILRRLAERRAIFLKAMAFDSPQSPYCLRNFRCFLAYSQADPGNNPIRIEGVVQILSQLKTALEMLRLPVTVWEPEDLINTLEGMLCLDPSNITPRKRRWNPLDSIQSQITSAESSLQVGSNGLALNNGDIQVRTYQVRQYPERWSLTFTCS